MDVIATWPGQSALADVGAFAARVERLGFDVLHVPETIHDPFMAAVLALTHTSRLVVRTSMVVAFPRSPMLTAYAAWDLARLSGGRFQLGMASQVRGNIVGRYGTPWTEPVTRLSDYIGAVRAIFHSFQTGDELAYASDNYTFDRLQPYFNPGPNDVPPPAIWMGGVNHGMCALAGEVADGFVCHPTNSHPRVIDALIRPAIAEGIDRGGRDDGGPTMVAGPQPIVAADDDGLRAAREARRAELGFLYSTPAYRPQLELFGLAAISDALGAMAKASAWDGLADLMTDEVIATLVPQGTYDQIPDVLHEWYAGACSGLVLTLPDPPDDGAYAEVVARCRRIPTS
ncbi:TIGR03617 family F420-dependent LLM class oxidoreductase [Nocardioides humilatus]|uniref:TIGR03617 family F420-dependent LLM class oxidoreductase n=1 Tax=Nocardioides humilatus TaxID=2607660 RepID=A0A5B1LHN4_9ACTN|nr:TIGR03617 family F420-dependent LLM class oxidoreductase [Nocardioides humilatus]KAA1420163.1 TIGR03617 family F420-dependent LLM class oxidoreductase [Nocardioides humilatus]